MQKKNGGVVERDPVCGMNVTPERAVASAEFGGKKYFFCAKSCAAKFERDPNKYLTAQMLEGMHGTGHSARGGLISIGGMAPPQKTASKTNRAASDEAKRTRYTCPMHPEVVQIGPGSCPKCGMALEPMDVVEETGPDPEYISMRLRFWVSAELS